MDEERTSYTRLHFVNLLHSEYPRFTDRWTGLPRSSSDLAGRHARKVRHSRRISHDYILALQRTCRGMPQVSRWSPRTRTLCLRGHGVLEAAVFLALSQTAHASQHSRVQLRLCTSPGGDAPGEEWSLKPGLSGRRVNVSRTAGGEELGPWNAALSRLMTLS